MTDSMPRSNVPIQASNGGSTTPSRPRWVSAPLVANKRPPRTRTCSRVSPLVHNTSFTGSLSICDRVFGFSRLDYIDGYHDVRSRLSVFFFFDMPRTTCLSCLSRLFLIHTLLWILRCNGEHKCLGVHTWMIARHHLAFTPPLLTFPRNVPQR